MRPYQTSVHTNVQALLQKMAQNVWPDDGVLDNPKFERYSILIRMEFIAPRMNRLVTIWAGRVDNFVWGYCDVRPAWVIKVTGEIGQGMPDVVDTNLWTGIRDQLDHVRFKDDMHAQKPKTKRRSIDDLMEADRIIHPDSAVYGGNDWTGQSDWSYD